MIDQVLVDAGLRGDAVDARTAQTVGDELGLRGVEDLARLASALRVAWAPDLDPVARSPGRCATVSHHRAGNVVVAARSAAVAPASSAPRAVEHHGMEAVGVVAR